MGQNRLCQESDKRGWEHVSRTLIEGTRDRVSWKSQERGTGCLGSLRRGGQGVLEVSGEGDRVS